jgi:hypothetical protein
MKKMGGIRGEPEGYVEERCKKNLDFLGCVSPLKISTSALQYWPFGSPLYLGLFRMERARVCLRLAAGS